MNADRIDLGMEKAGMTNLMRRGHPSHENKKRKMSVSADRVAHLRRGDVPAKWLLFPLRRLRQGHQLGIRGGQGRVRIRIEGTERRHGSV